MIATASFPESAIAADETDDRPDRQATPPSPTVPAICRDSPSIASRSGEAGAPATAARPDRVTLSALPAAPLPPPAPAVFETPVVRFFGRSLAEYLRFFSLDIATLRGRRILDTAAGPSSFAVEAGALGLDVTAADPLYGCTSGTLDAYVRIDYATVFRQIRAKPGLVRCDANGADFCSIDAAEADRRAAATRFLDDYETGFPSGRYVSARLPHLPFADGEFDLVLCAHFLFLHAAQFDAAFHLAACCELVRVSRGEVRIHPVCGNDGLRYPALATLREALARDGITSREEPVPPAFFRGADSMLVLERG
ncbi:MAG: class I SAM-dependent methyltransferase [Opitutaceae bacterium]|nr:class I SAM-dependent methyltransferase [Opitutaceae bacterium]